jgi:chromate transporter
VNLLVLYFVMLKATITAFSGLSSLPVLRDELVVNHHVLTDAQINTAMVAGRISPGPLGMFVVSIGYYVAGIPGAIAAWLALATPALVVIPILRYIGARAERPLVRDALNAVVLASVGLMLSALRPLMTTSVTGVTTLLIALVSCAALMFSRRVYTGWVILGASLSMVVVSMFRSA